MPGWPRLIVVLGVLMISLVTSGCGRKGPLYLPEKPAADSAPADYYIP